MSGAVDLAALAGQQGQVQIMPWVIELQGQVNVRRVDGMRVLEVIHPSGVIAARLVLDPINAAAIARELSPPGEALSEPASPNGLAVDGE